VVSIATCSSFATTIACSRALAARNSPGGEVSVGASRRRCREGYAGSACITATAKKGRHAAEAAQRYPASPRAPARLADSAPRARASPCSSAGSQPDRAPWPPQWGQLRAVARSSSRGPHRMVRNRPESRSAPLPSVCLLRAQQPRDSARSTRPALRAIGGSAGRIDQAARRAIQNAHPARLASYRTPAMVGAKDTVRPVTKRVTGTFI
jgi:hypothetical protein